MRKRELTEHEVIDLYNDKLLYEIVAAGIDDRSHSQGPDYPIWQLACVSSAMDAEELIASLEEHPAIKMHISAWWQSIGERRRTLLQALAERMF